MEYGSKWGASWLALALLVARVGANDTDNAFATNNFAIFAKLFNRCANFHILNRLSFDDDTTLGQVVRRHFQLHRGPQSEADKVEPGAARHERHQSVAVGQLHAVGFVR